MLVTIITIRSSHVFKMLQLNQIDELEMNNNWKMLYLDIVLPIKSTTNYVEQIHLNKNVKMLPKMSFNLEIILQNLTFKTMLNISFSSFVSELFPAPVVSIGQTMLDLAFLALA